MKIEELHLARYGHFSDQLIDFSSDTGNLNLHIVYGDNEAGKSTTFEALLDLLFGIPRKSQYTFIHERKELRIAARIHSAGKTHDLIRSSRGLMDSSGAVLAEDHILPMLGGLDRQNFSARFSMNEESLKEGGEAILASKGNLGSLLFSAGSGLGNLESHLNSLLTDSEGAYYGVGSKKQWAMTRDLDELKTLDEKLKSLDIQAKEWKRRRTLVHTCETNRQDAENTHQKAEKAALNARTVIERHKASIQLKKDRDQLQSQLPPPTVPDAWLMDIDVFIDELKPIVKLIEEQEMKLSHAQRFLAEPAPCNALLDAKDQIRGLKEQASLLVSQTQVLDQNRIEIEEQHTVFTGVFKELGVASDASLESIEDPILDDRILAQLLDLSHQHGALSEHVHQTQAQLERAKHTLDHSDPLVDDDPPDTAALRRLIEEIESDTSIHRLADLDQQKSSLLEELNLLRVSLEPWRGEIRDLSSLNLPSKSVLETQATRLRTKQDEYKQLNADKDTLITRRQQLAQTLEVERTAFDDERWHKQQDAQWQQWRLHRDAIARQADTEELQATADSFEQSLRLTQNLAQQRDDHHATVAEYRLTQAAIAKLDDELDRAIRHVEQAEAALHEEQQAIDAHARSMGLPAGFDISTLQTWIAQRESALKLAIKLDLLEQQITECTDRRAVYVQRLLHQLKECREPLDTDRASLEQRLKQSREFVEACEQRRAQHQHAIETHERLKSDHERALGEAEKAQQAFQHWSLQWNQAIAGSVLSERPPRELIVLLDELRRVADARRDTLAYQQAKRRLHQLREDHNASIDRLSEQFAHLLDPSRQDRLAALSSCVEEAVALQKQRQQHTSNRAESEAALVELNQRYGDRLKVLSERYEATNTQSLQELHAVLTRCKDHSERSRNTAQQIEEIAQSLDLSAAELMDDFVNRDPVEFESELASRQADLDQAVTDREHCAIQLRDARQSLAEIGDDDTLTLLRESRLSVWQRLKDATQEALAVRVGIGVAREGIRQWRSEHRSEMLSNATDVFVSLTNGRFTDLMTEPSGDGEERLLARSATGAIKGADQLSKGTQYQLYLSLRVAAYRQWCQHHPPPPFIADDVLETFDDERTASTFRAFSDMAQHGQIIYLTHHRHVIDIAQEVTKGCVSVHELPSPMERLRA